MSPRFVFAAASIAEEEDDKMEGKEATPIAVGELGEAVGWDGESELSEEQKMRVRDQVDRAHAKGMKVFYRGLNKLVEFCTPPRAELISFSLRQGQ